VLAFISEDHMALPIHLSHTLAPQCTAQQTAPQTARQHYHAKSRSYGRRYWP